MNILHIIMLKLLKGATAVLTVVTVCNHDFYAFIASIPTDVLSAITENYDRLSAITENYDFRATISTDSTDTQSVITENYDYLAEIC